jgi:hypothetical protein
MAKGISIHIGLNNVDTAAYPGVEVPVLSGCLNDAASMRDIAASQGFTATTLTESQATHAAVLGAISQAAADLVAGDILLITYAGHGAQVPDETGDETDTQDETWVLYDKMMLDDELAQLWHQFAGGVRVFVVSDSCHSGTMVRGDFSPPPERDPNFVRRKRGLLPQAALAAYRLRREEYRAIQFLTAKRSRGPAAVSVLLISGCQDNQVSWDGSGHGLFTENLLAVWNNATYAGDHPGFHGAIVAKMPSYQTPNFDRAGANNPTFEAQRPFSIGGVPAVAPNPTVSGPAVWSRGPTPPAFSVDAGGRYYVLEVASDPSLFDITANGANRTATNFYGSWSDQPRATGTTYTLPQAAWEKVRVADRLYYRVGSTPGPTGWDDYRVSAGDEAGTSAPYLDVIDDRSLAAAPPPRRSGRRGVGRPRGPRGGVSHHFDVELVPQPTKSSCWAASMAMLVGFRQQTSMDAERMAESVGYSLYSSYGWDALEAVKAQYGFRVVSLPSNASLYFEPARWAEWLEAYGPLWLTTVGAPSHAIVIRGLQGDLSRSGTTVEVLNPWDVNTTFSTDPVIFDPPNRGMEYSVTFDDFANQFGSLGLDAYGDWRVLYLPGQRQVADRS